MRTKKKRPAPEDRRDRAVKAETGRPQVQASRAFYYLKADQLIRMSHSLLCRSL